MSVCERLMAKNKKEAKCREKFALNRVKLVFFVLYYFISLFTFVCYLFPPSTPEHACLGAIKAVDVDI